MFKIVNLIKCYVNKIYIRCRFNMTVEEYNEYMDLLKIYKDILGL